MAEMRRWQVMCLIWHRRMIEGDWDCLGCWFFLAGAVVFGAHLREHLRLSSMATLQEFASLQLERNAGGRSLFDEEIPTDIRPATIFVSTHIFFLFACPWMLPSFRCEILVICRAILPTTSIWHQGCTSDAAVESLCETRGQRVRGKVTCRRRFPRRSQKHWSGMSTRTGVLHNPTCLTRVMHVSSRWTYHGNELCSFRAAPSWGCPGTHRPDCPTGAHY